MQYPYLLALPKPIIWSCQRIFCVFLLQLGLPLLSWAQFGDPPIPKINRASSADLIAEGLSYYDMGSYEEAISYYRQIHPSDTNYYRAISELSLAYLALGQAEKALSLSDSLFALPAFVPQVNSYTHRGAILQQMGRREAALKAYQEGAMTFPFKHLIWYNLGVIQFNGQNYKQAYQSFLEAVSCNPYHRNSILFLGQLELNQGHFTKALLCFENYIMASPNNFENRQVAATLERLCQNGFDIPLNPIYQGISSNEGFEAMDSLLTSKKALAKSYKLHLKKADYALLRQTQLLMENWSIDQPSTPTLSTVGLSDQLALLLSDTAQTKPLELQNLALPSSPWFDVWSPLFKRIYEEQLFEVYAYSLISTVEDNKIPRRQLSKKPKKLDQLYVTIREQWNTIAKARKIRLATKEIMLQSWHDATAQHPAALGNMENGKRQGYWRFFQKNGFPIMEGFFKDGKKEGPWRVYDEEGLLKEAYSTKGNLVKGNYYGYTEGKMSERAFYGEEELLQGTLEYLYTCGTVAERFQYKDGKKEGENILFYPNAQLKARYRYHNDLLSGEAKTYYPNGQLEADLSYAENFRDGQENGYHLNGQLAYEGQWDAGYRVGKWAYYDDQGRMQGKMYFDEGGNQIGLYEWYEEGKKTEELNYFNDNLIGRQLYLDTATGNPYAAYYYSPSKLDSVTFYHAATGEVVERIIGGERFDLRIYDAQGRLYSEGEYTGLQQDGNWTVYFPGGEIAQTYRLMEGATDGPYRTYWPTGPIKKIRHYQSGRQTGYAATYYPHGAIMEEGWLENSNRDGIWKEFFPDKTLKEQAYWIKGQEQGWKHAYAPSGEKSHSIYQTANGEVLEAVSYNAQGEVVGHLQGMQPFDTLKLYHANGALKMEAPQQCHLFSGTTKWYYANGQLKSREQMRLGVQHGIYRLYHSNGAIWVEGAYTNGVPDGQWNWFSAQGQLLEKGAYTHGALTGLASTFYANGQLKAQSFYSQNKLHGSTKKYGIKGNLAVELWYEDGAIRKYRYGTDTTSKKLTAWKKVAPQGLDTLTAYYANGQKAIEYPLKNAYLHGKVKCYYFSGMPESVTDYSEGVKQGVQKTFYPNGQLKEEANFLYNQLHGTKQTFSREGKRLLTQEFQNGEPSGKKIIYQPENGEVKKVWQYWNGFQMEGNE